jgi:hypothetical protein
VLPLAAFAAGVFASPKRWGARILPIVIVVGSGVFLLSAVPICWKEAEVNSEARRDWTHQAAEFLAHEYQPGAGILYSFGDLTGVLREAGIPLKEGLHDGNHPQWDAVMARPDLALHEEWALAFAGDQVATLLLSAQPRGVHYQLRKQIMVKGSPVVEIYQREP